MQPGGRVDHRRSAPRQWRHGRRIGHAAEKAASVKEFFSDEADNLAQEYVRRGVFPEKFASDANHVAIAVVNGIGYLASWNFRHLVRVNTRREVNLGNALEGYNPIEIVAPPEL